MIELDKSYDASKYEADIYQIWMDSGYFNPDNLPSIIDSDGATKEREPFTIVLPPPNVTGTMHVGHSLGVTIQDIFIRTKRMQGFKTLWLPGTDHAAIATQTKVEKILEKEEGKRKTDIGREAFLEKVDDFAKNSHDTIVSQLKAMGASLDWSREAFTLDEKRNFAVRTAFKAMYDDGLIYRGHKVINWDPKGQTVISDEEIVHQERDAILYTFNYSSDFPISISTTRPETKVGDTAVAVHPDDERYAKYVGQEFDLVFAGVPLHIKVVADEEVDKDFGTGALGVTPAHSLIDAEIALRHNLPMKQVINEYAKMTVGGGEGEIVLEGKKTTEAREIIVEWLKSQNLITKEEPVKQNVATAERSGGVIEPLPKLQWFLAVNKEYTQKGGAGAGNITTLKQQVSEVVRDGHINITPAHFSKTYFHWVDNLRDWCISRQLWYGHRIPVWYKGDEVYCGIEAPEGDDWLQDEDTLDTWFSAGLWTFTTLGWPEQTSDLETFHPTDILETGYDILPFWVMRMILMSMYHLNQIPFKMVYLHGLIRDDKNRKMSKSLGNIIDPVDMIAKFGTDALRFALVFNTAPGTDMALAEDKIKGMKHFGNKLWNITRYILQNTTKESFVNLQPKEVTDEDKLMLSQLAATVELVTTQIAETNLHIAAQGIYDFTWHALADVYIEKSKGQLENAAEKETTQQNLAYALVTTLKLLHPFMPFVTEVLWQELSRDNLTQEKLLLVAQWPK